MKCTAKMIIEQAKKELGNTEKKTNSGYGSKTENAGHNNWNKYADYIDNNFPTFYNGRKNGYLWCDIFVDYLFLFCFGVENALRMLYQPLKSEGASCTSSRAYYKKAGRYGKTPKVGAQIMFTKDGGKTCYHTGIVIAIEGQNVITIEGNSGDKVSQLAYNINDPRIDGYGYPLYDEEPNTTTKEETKMKSDLEIAQEVVKGIWGIGEDRRNNLTKAGYNYSKIQEIVNALVKGEVITVKVPKGNYKQIIINFE